MAGAAAHVFVADVRQPELDDDPSSEWFNHHFADVHDLRLLREPIKRGVLRMAIVFADLVGFVRFTEEEGEDEALDLLERFIVSVEDSLPAGARVVKNIGDGVMIVGTDPVGLVDWALGFQEGFAKRSRPRIGIHYGDTIYRDGDYYGRSVNLAARVVSRAQGGEVLLTEPVYDMVPPDPKLSFEPIGEAQLKGIADPVALYVARSTDVVNAADLRS